MRGVVPELYVSISHLCLISKERKENQNVLSHFLSLGCVVTQRCCGASFSCACFSVQQCTSKHLWFDFHKQFLKGRDRNCKDAKKISLKTLTAVARDSENSLCADCLGDKFSMLFMSIHCEH